MTRETIAPACTIPLPALSARAADLDRLVAEVREAQARGDRAWRSPRAGDRGAERTTGAAVPPPRAAGGRPTVGGRLDAGRAAPGRSTEVAMECLCGLPRGSAAEVVEVTVQQRGLHFRHGGFLRGWSFDLPLDMVASVELTTARELAIRGTLPAGVVAPPEHPGEHLLAIEARQGDGTSSIVLRGQWAEVDQLRQAILKARMRAAKQWKS